jgi:hypothetical protein
MRRLLLCMCLMTAPAFADICILDPVTVSQLEGSVVYRSKEKDGGVVARDVSVQIRRYDVQHTLVVEPDAEDKFCLVDVPLGEYELRLVSPAATLSVELNVVRPGLLHGFPANWLEGGLGLVQPEGCPAMYGQSGSNAKGAHHPGIGRAS